VAEGRTEDADALASFALCCVQLRGDHKQHLKPTQTLPAPAPHTTPPREEKEKIDPNLLKQAVANNSPAKSTFGRFFGTKESKDEILKGHKEGHEKEKEKEGEHSIPHNQSTVVTMITPPHGSVPSHSIGGFEDNTRDMEILDIIEVRARCTRKRVMAADESEYHSNTQHLISSTLLYFTLLSHLCS
jgi:hypothetical protein